MRTPGREEAPDPLREPAAVPSAAPRGRAESALLLRLQRSAGNAAVTALVSGRSVSGSSAPRPAPLTAGDVNVIARLADTARMRRALEPPPGALQPDLFKAAAADRPPVHPADLAAGDLDSPVDSGDRPASHSHQPRRRGAVRPPAPVPAVDPQVDAQATQLAELRAQVPELAREIVDAALGPRGQVPEYRALAEPGVAGEEQAVARIVQAAVDPTAAARALGAYARARIPALAQELEAQAIKTLGWEPLNQVGMMQSPGFEARNLILEVRGAIEGWGTDEERLFKALEGHTPLQIEAMRKAYQATYGKNMDEEVKSELSGTEEERAKQLLTGDPLLGAIATLRDAINHVFADKAAIMHTLRGLSAAERTTIAGAYWRAYQRQLKFDLEHALSDYEFQQATALLVGDTVKADAIALKDATDKTFSTDRDAVHAVYARIRDEVEHEAAAQGWSTEQVEAEIKKRNEQLTGTYHDTYGGKDDHQDTLEHDLRGALHDGQLDLVLAEKAGDRTAADAAALKIEHESMWTSDDKVNDILKAQYQRAEREVMRDQALIFQQQAASLPRDQRAALWKAYQQDGQVKAQERARGYIGDLKSAYDQHATVQYGDDGTAYQTNFDRLIGNELIGYSRDEAKERIADGGKLSDEKELKYAIFGPGTNEKTIREVLKGKSKAELQALGDKYRRLTGNDLLEDLKGDLSGRDEADMTILLDTGASTPAERLAYLDKRTGWEAGGGTGEIGQAFDDEEVKILLATNQEAKAAYAEYEHLKDRPEDDPQRKAAFARLERWLGYGDKDIDRHREELDRVTDNIALAGAIAALVTSAILVGPAAAAWAAYFAVSQSTVVAAVSSISAVSASMALKQGMKGEAYGGEEFVTNLAQSTASVVINATTAGMGGAAVRALSRAPAFAILARAAEGGLLARMAVAGLGDTFESAIQGVPKGMLAAILNEDTWRSPDPLGVILQGAGGGARFGAVVGGGLGTVFPAIQAGVGGLRGIGKPTATPGSAASHDAEPSAPPAGRDPAEPATPVGGERRSAEESDYESIEIEE